MEFVPREVFLKMSTKRLLIFYKSERRKMFRAFSCSCCSEFPSPALDVYGKKELKKVESYLLEIKTELDKREHINKRK